jgi:hypothetical protein
MLRTLAGVAAAGLLLWAGILVGSGATVSYAGTSTTCAGPIVRAETRSAGIPPATGHVAAGLERACDRTDRQRLLWASVAAALALGAAAYAAGRLPQRPEVRPAALTPA